MSIYVHKSHNVSVLLYHLVFTAKYRRAVLDSRVDVWIVSDSGHIHFLVQSVPKLSVTKLVTMIKSLTSRGVFVECPWVKKQLWGGEFWSDGYFASTVSKHGDESTMTLAFPAQDFD